MKREENNVFIFNQKADTGSLLTALASRVNKLTAMIIVISSDDFIDYDAHQIHNYFWSLQGFAEEISQINQVLQERYLENRLEKNLISEP